MKKSLILINFLMLGGCVFGTSEPSVFYTLQPHATQESVSRVKTSVGVTEAEIQGVLGNPQIVLRGEEATQITISETNRWGEPLSVLLQRTLVNNLIGYLPNSFVKMKAYSSEQFKYTVSVDVDNMTGTLGGNAVLSVWWQINNRAGNTVARQYSVFTAPAGDTYDSYVTAQSGLVNDLAKQIATKIGTLAK